MLAHLDANGFLVTSPAVVEPPVDHGFLRTLSVRWTGADRVVRRLHAAGLHRLFTRAGVAAQLLLAVVGTVAIV